MEKKQGNEVQLLSLLKQVLPKATHDPKLAGQIYDAIETELKMKNKQKSFEKFCSRCELPDMEPASIDAVRKQLSDSFAQADVTVKPNKKEKVLAVEVALADGSHFEGLVRAGAAPEGEDSGDQDVPMQFVPFPVSLPTDPELVWVLGKTENLTSEEAAIALAKVEDAFWGSKTGQKLIRDRIERCFPEFIERVPAALLKEAGLKRHYKMAEPIKVLQPAKE